ncbi:MAG: hypothetical protein LBR61_02785 [Synergistaceae bacterium]|nr:hypothetical protein [Synergistaceae bacterium]
MATGSSVTVSDGGALVAPLDGSSGTLKIGTIGAKIVESTDYAITLASTALSGGKFYVPPSGSGTTTVTVSPSGALATALGINIDPARHEGIRVFPDPLPAMTVGSFHPGANDSSYIGVTNPDSDATVNGVTATISSTGDIILSTGLVTYAGTTVRFHVYTTPASGPYQSTYVATTGDGLWAYAVLDVEVGTPPTPTPTVYTLTLTPDSLDLNTYEAVSPSKVINVTYDVGAAAGVTLVSFDIAGATGGILSQGGLTYQTNMPNVTTPTVTVSGTPSFEGFHTVTVVGAFSDNQLASADLRVTAAERIYTGILRLTPATLTMILNQNDSKTVSADITTGSSEVLSPSTPLTVSPTSLSGLTASVSGSVITISGTPTSAGLKTFTVTGRTVSNKKITATIQVNVLSSAGTGIVISDPTDALVYTGVTGTDAHYFYNVTTGESNFNVGRTYTITIPCSTAISLVGVVYSSPTSSALQSLPASSYSLVSLPDGTCNVVIEFTPTTTGSYKFYIDYLYGGTQYRAPTSGLTFVATRATSGGSGLEKDGSGGCSSLSLGFAALALAGLALLRRRG